MRVFNGRAATEDYMSTHSLTFSTPEMTLRKFALWLGEQIESPKYKGQQIPRLITYLEDKNKKTSTIDYMPDVTERFEPSGAVTDMFGGISHSISDSSGGGGEHNSQTSPLDLKGSYSQNNDEGRFCIECGSKLRSSSKFCMSCGTRQP
jgi:hypothetical protein